jgi:hypothetical protein
VLVQSNEETFFLLFLARFREKRYFCRQLLKRKSDGGTYDGKRRPEVDVADISLVVNTIINPDDIISTTSADANGDGVVNIADIVTIISEITNQR